MSLTTVALAAHPLLLRKTRLLPWEGEVLAARGRAVHPEDVVARAERQRWHFSLPVAAMLGEEGRDVSACLQKRPGEAIAAGEVVAVKRGLFGRTAAVCHCPEAGVLVDYRVAEGLLVIRRKSQTIDLLAGLEGRIAAVVPDRGVVIETQAILMQGLALAGSEAYGPLVAGTDVAGGKVAVPTNAEGTVLFGGYTDLQGLREAAAAGAKAVLAGSVDLEGWQAAKQGAFASMAVVPLECIGQVGLGQRTFAALQGSVGSQTLVTPAGDKGQRPLRPEVIICHRTQTTTEPPLPRLQLGAEVRICAGPRRGSWGRIASLGLNQTSAADNITTAEVVPADGEPVTVPLADLELLG